MAANSVIVKILSGVEDGKFFEFSVFPINLGRHPEDDVFLPYDIRTSRHHALISQIDNTFFLADAGSEGKGSTNGTYLNEKRITDETQLSSGDIFLLGNVWLKFELKS
ncbi:MAG: FHA domain-containing protein [Dehalococcoidales bacterium]|nr:FHA domain-containing protein [Dehalococcoidales bacterium]